MTQRYDPGSNEYVLRLVIGATYLWVDLLDFDIKVDVQAGNVRYVVDEHYNPVRRSFMAMIS